MSKRVAITGSSGLIGGALSRHLESRGDKVLRVVRRRPSGPGEVSWDPARGVLDPAVLEGVDALVNLAGVGIGEKRWNAAHKRAIERTRTDATWTAARALAEHRERTGETIRLVNASTIGYYGDRGEEVLTESSENGRDFLARIVARWEAAADAAREAGVPVAYARSALVMAQHGGIFERVLLLTRLGLSGPMGSGEQWWSWISLVDEVRALTFLIDRPDLTGAFNLAAPEPARQKAIARAIPSALHRPALVPAPRLAMRAVVGEVADTAVISQRIVPAALLAAGFEFEHPDLGSAVSWMVGG